ncbi:MAG: prolipoprotein diacylglyceryl transferase [Anaerolineae bacterium]|nr:prolipoprotein diacylglyceryl transferase [Anaerolineae bacterium]
MVIELSAAALVFVWSFFRARLGKWPPSPRDILYVTPYASVGVWIGAWLFAFVPSLVNSTMAYLTQGVPFLPQWWWPHRHWMGVVAGGFLGGYIYCRVRRLPVGGSFDLVVPVMPLIHILGRIGCLCAGCCYGRETTAWPAMVLPDIHGVWASRYPTRIVSILANSVILILLLVFERYADRRRGDADGWPFGGFLFLLYVELYCIQRFFFEFWRADMPYLVAPFTWTHLYCVIAIALATWQIVRKLRLQQMIRKSSTV